MFEGDVLKGAHLFMATLLPASMSISSRIIKLDTRPAVSFQLSDNDLLPNIPSTADPAASTPFSRRADTSQQHFPIDLLATPSSTSSITPRAHYQTPNYIAADDPDAMDWTPSHKPSSFSFTRASRPASNTTSFTSAPHTGPSPFRGTLPAAPIPPAHRLRKPPTSAPGAFRKATETQKTQFSANLRNAIGSATPAQNRQGGGPLTTNEDINNDLLYDTDATTETEDGARRLDPRRTSRRSARANGDMQLAAPKFWPQGDLDRKTGLEDIFEEGLAIGDTPREVSRRGVLGRTGAAGGEGRRGSGSKRERWGGFGDLQEGGDGAAAGAAAGDGVPRGSAVAIENARTGGDGGSWSSVFVIGLVPAACLGVAIAVVKGGYL